MDLGPDGAGDTLADRCGEHTLNLALRWYHLHMFCLFQLPPVTRTDLINPSRRLARALGPISALRNPAVATAMPAVSRLDLEPNSRTRLGPGFLRWVLA